tara:strand:+ start:26672 stop:26812 length:141 start_codon:yes stop_codon:yes gene_type:complete
MEPLIGSGPYRMLKEEADRILKKNEKFPDSSKVEISAWKLVCFVDT